MPLTDQIDDDLLMFLPSAPTKVVPLRVMTADAEHLETRVSAVSSTIQAKAASWWQKFWAWLTAIPAGVFTLLTLMLGNVQQAIETVQPLRNFLTEVPVWVWGGGVFAVALVLALNARKISQQVEKTEDALVTGYREGTVKNDKDVKLAEFVSVLSRATPRMVSKLDLGFALWGMHAPEDPLLANRLGTYATHARRMMEEAGVRIENAEARGFRLIVVEEP
jgi:hypothetical protein